MELIRQQAAADVAAGLAGAAAIPAASAGKAAVVAAVTQWVHAAIAADRKVTALKALQGHIWQAGFQSGALKAELFRWVRARGLHVTLPALEAGTQVCNSCV